MEPIKNNILQVTTQAIISNMDKSERVAYMKLNAIRFGIPENGFKSKK